MNAQARVVLCGAAGGAINAWLYYLLPLDAWEFGPFTWHLVPAGALHGGVLAGAAFSAGTALADSRLLTRLAAALPLGWLAGFVSWIPLDHAVFDHGWSASLTWPFHADWGEAAFTPFECFGFVALFYYLAVAFRLARTRSLLRHVVGASGAGALGSLLLWTLAGPWYLSFLHGAVWGTLVGVGAWARGSGISGKRSGSPD